MSQAVSSIELRIRQARRRLMLQSFLHRVISLMAVALGLALIWLLIHPMIFPNPTPTVQILVVGSLLVLGILVAIVQSIRFRPTRLEAALTLDQRFDLRERLTTALSLDESSRQTSIGQALIHDAENRVKALKVRERFPLQLTSRAWLVPGQVILLALMVWLYQPQFASNQANARNGENAKELAKGKIDDPNAPKATPKIPIRKPADRSDKSESLKELEKELDKLYGEVNKKEDRKPEEARAKIEQLSGTEEKLKKYVEEQTGKFQRLQEQLSKLDYQSEKEQNRDPSNFSEQMKEALAKGDLQKAKELVDELKKKAKDKKMSEEDAKKLEREVQQLAEKLERLARNEKEQKKLQDLINQAKKEGRDAESLERELHRLQQESAQMKELQQLAKKLSECKQCMEKKDFEGLDKNLSDLAKQLQEMENELQDLEDAEEHLQNLKQLRKGLCKECEGEGDRESDKPGEKDYAKGKGIASGKRPENPDAKSNNEDARQRGFFDAKGRKRYGGSTEGPAFTKRTTTEMSGEIHEAVQEAAEAMEVQRLRKSDQQAVKEYFERLGRQAPKK